MRKSVSYISLAAIVSLSLAACYSEKETDKAQPTSESVGTTSSKSPDANTAKSEDAEEARERTETGERQRLLRSEDPGDWKALTEKYPASVEAKAAAEKLSKSASLCADLSIWTDLIEAETNALAQFQARYKSKNLLAEGVLELVKISSDFQKEAIKHQQAMEEAAIRLDKHAIKDDEKRVQSDLSMAILDRGLLWKKYAKAFKAGTEGFVEIAKTTSYINDVVVPESKAMLDAVDVACKKSKPSKGEPACTPCSTQEDFDAAMKAGSKCCPVMACNSDVECYPRRGDPPGRVCCKIPGGQLCADPGRCKGSNRVEAHD